MYPLQYYFNKCSTKSQPFSLKKSTVFNSVFENFFKHCLLIPFSLAIFKENSNGQTSMFLKRPTSFVNIDLPTIRL